VTDLADRIEVMRQKKRVKRAADRVVRELEEAQIKRNRDRRSAENRRKFPYTALVVDAFKELGISVKVLSVERVCDE